MSVSKTCNICAENFNKRDRSLIACAFCHFETCRTCVETFLTTVQEPKCMQPSCGKTWTRLFLTQNLTHAFLNTTYKQYREKLFFEKETALMPATQIVVEEQIRKEKNEEEVRLMDERIQELTRARQALAHTIHHAPPVSAERKVFIRRCGDGDCRGFLSTQWKCGLCEKWTCKDCHVIKEKGKEEEHVCLKDDVETANLLSSDTKGCPKCATLIYKISGCDQMWCTQCHTAFSWKTGRIETHIHNPHFYEWMRRTGGAQRNVDDIVQCGHELTQQFTSRINVLIRSMKLNGDLMSRASMIVGSTIHIRMVELERYRVDNVINNEKLRVDYMRNRIEEDKFKVLVQREHIKYEKKKEIHDILTMFIQSSTDIMFRFREEMETMDKDYRSLATRAVKSVPSDVKLRAILAEMEPLVAYVNECFETVAKTYNSVTLEINIPVSATNYQFNTILASREKKAGPKPKAEKAASVATAVVDLTVDYLN
jgi:hypothetical protein